MAGELQIGNRRIHDDGECFVIAEVGHNHQGSLETCKKLFDAARECGADAVKLQKRDNRVLFTKAMYGQIYNSENAFAETYGAHREFLEFGRDEYRELKKYAEDLGMEFFAAVFDIPSADFMRELDVSAFKLPSGMITDLELQRHVANLGKPVVMSTGTATMEDVDRAVRNITQINPRLALLQCTAGYPVEFEELDLNVIRTYREKYPDVVIGASMHDNGIAMPLVAYVLGARIIEKHFTLNRTMKGTDHAFSLEPVGLRKMVRDLRRARVAFGDGKKKLYDSEIDARKKMGKSLYAVRALPAGTALKREDLTLKSPGGGFSPAELDRLLGSKLVKPVAEEEILTSEHLDGKRS